MDQKWIADEKRFWAAMMDPGRGRRRVTMHSMQPGPARNQLKMEIEKQKQQDFAAGWQFFASWVKH